MTDCLTPEACNPKQPAPSCRLELIFMERWVKTARSYIDMFAAAACRSAKPHYLLTTRPGVMDRALVGVLCEHGVAAVGGFREGLMAIDRLARNAK
jgi:hypothetical protein